MKQYELFELSFPCKENNELTAAFTCGGKTVTVKGFYAGDGVMKVRYLPETAGEVRWEVAGAVNASGSEICESADEGRQGLVRAVGTHFAYADGTRYTPVGTTIYALVHQPAALVDETMETLRAAPFNKVRLCVFPKHFVFNSNEPELFAFEKTDGKFDTSKPCLAFWDMLEARLRELDAMGIEADLILFHPYDRWGFATLTEDECRAYLDYLTRRLAAFPNVWWSLANEYDVLGDFEPERWPRLAAFVREHDPYGHLLSNHHCIFPWDASDPSTTHVCLQDSHFARTPMLQQKYGKPVVFDEVGYEGDLPYPWGSLSGFELVNRFWMAVSLGGYCTHGETFWNEEDILWWAKGGSLRGGSVPRIAFLRQLMESLPGDLTPVPPHHDRPKLLAAMTDPAEAAKILPVDQRVARMDDDWYLSFADCDQDYAGWCGDSVLLHYLARQCASWIDLQLPENKTYTVEVLDVWEMTRKTVLTGVSGAVKVPLPGKEGIAVLATAE